VSGEQPALEISLDLKYNETTRTLTVPCVVNGKNAVFMVDSGAGTQVMSIANSKAYSLKPNPSLDAAVHTLGGRRNTETATIEDFQLGSMLIKSAFVAIMADEDWKTIQFAGAQYDGILGNDLLKLLEAKIDYGAMKLTLKAPKGAIEVKK
jgi:hypothetical protein